MESNSFKKEIMNSGDPKKRPGGGSGNEGSRDSSADTTRTTFEAKKESGRVQFDERGNAIWEWAVSTGAFGREVSTERMKKLENPGLSLAEDAPTPSQRVKANPLGAVKGYNPYDSGKLGKPREVPKKKDLKKL